MNLRTSQKQLQKTVMTQSMQQSIELLLLPLGELQTVIDQELLENPMLELDEEATRASNDHLESVIHQTLKAASLNKGVSNSEHNFDDESLEERPISRSISLEEHLLNQLRLENLNEQELDIGEFIIGNLDEDGFIHLDVEHVARQLDTTPEKVEGLIKIIQQFDPLGVASRNLPECLLVQIGARYTEDFDLYQKIINEHLNDLGRKRYTEIARQLKLPLEQIKDLARHIAALEPKPARKYRNVDETMYVKPDITIQKDDHEGYHVVINTEFIPKLRINALYQKLLKDPGRNKKELEFLNEKLKSALFFIKSIEQRNSTLRGIAEYIAKYQKDFFDNGHMHLRPMVLKNVANAIERNESTVSRAINHKFMDTPQGFYPMKFFFSQKLSASRSSQSPEDISSRSIKEELKNIIKDEDKQRPLSDMDIQKYFEKKGTKVARRTISKYRKMLHILPSHLRKA